MGRTAVDDHGLPGHESGVITTKKSPRRPDHPGARRVEQPRLSQFFDFTLAAANRAWLFRFFQPSYRLILPLSSRPGLQLRLPAPLRVPLRVPPQVPLRVPLQVSLRS